MKFGLGVVIGGTIFLICITIAFTLTHDDDHDAVWSSSGASNRGPRSTRRDAPSKKKPGKGTTTENPDDEDSDEEDADPEDEDEDEDDRDHKGGSKPSKGKKEKRIVRIIFEEQFSNRNWTNQWVYAKNSGSGRLYNKFSREYVRKSNHSSPNYGLVTNNKDGEFYMIATTFAPFSNRNETLLMQFSVQFQTRAHCQLVFMRLYDCQFTTEEFGVRTPYIMQVGPYVCGTSKLKRLTAEFQETSRYTIVPIDKGMIEPINNTSVTLYALALQPDGAFNVILNNNYVKNGSLTNEFQSFKGYNAFCGIGLVVWHSVLDKYFKGQIVVDDILIVNDMEFAEKQREKILKTYAD